MTFSIAAYDPKNGDLGIAVQSKFPNVGVTIPFAKAGVGAVATQCYCNTSFGPRGLSLLENGATPEQALEILVNSDQDHDYRQVGIIDCTGNAANFTGQLCFDSCGGLSGNNFTIQGNTLASKNVITAMAEKFQNNTGSLAKRLLATLHAGQQAGGDKRGQQSAALLVVRKNAGYGGHDDRYVDISVYDHPQPIQEVDRLFEIHKLSFFRATPDILKPATPDLIKEVQQILTQRQFYHESISGIYDTTTKKAWRDLLGWDNYDERIREDDLIDIEVLNDIKKKITLRNVQAI